MIQGISYTRITLALDIIKKIPDGEFAGYHELGIIKHQINLGDTITIEKSGAMKIFCDNPNVPLNEKNICWQAADLVKREFGIKENVSIDIEKKIPVQGGLAGGSSNAAETIKLLFELWDIEIPFSQKISLSRKLGMDVPFYFYGKSAFDSEAAQELHPIENNCKKMFFLLVIPPFGVSTKEAYAKIDYSKIGKNTDKTETIKNALKSGNIKKIAENMHNDFEQIVFLLHPELQDVKNNLLKFGANAAIMSGSGSTIFGIFDDFKTAEMAKDKFENVFLGNSL
ncbi:MAG: 4-(cytidine 5'-diphospho)-2-C-methyl-D-erythritol kinase [Chitinispirillales bacterium]|nr:4-(cytidine 5'-diphospho)-2-C-methyl-D-erythritol kinase [Chitinispirillales bacterium]